MNIHMFLSLVPAFADKTDQFIGYDSYKKYLRIYAEHAHYDAKKKDGWNYDVHEVKDCKLSDFDVYVNDTDTSAMVKYLMNDGYP